LSRGEKWLWRKIYSHFSTYPYKGEKWLWGKNASITPVQLLLVIRLENIDTKNPQKLSCPPPQVEKI
jgi:hypothetical protein